MGKPYKYVSNVDPKSGVGRVYPDVDDRDRFLDLGGVAGELSADEHKNLSRLVVFEDADAQDLPKPDGVPDSYDDLTAPEVIEMLDAADEHVHGAIVAYEKDNKNRKTIVEHEFVSPDPAGDGE
jgi:hypothetical protein